MLPQNAGSKVVVFVQISSQEQIVHLSVVSLGMVSWEVGERTVESDGRHEELGRVGGRVPAHDEDAWNWWTRVEAAQHGYFHLEDRHQRSRV